MKKLSLATAIAISLSLATSVIAPVEAKKLKKLPDYINVEFTNKLTVGLRKLIGTEVDGVTTVTNALAMRLQDRLFFSYFYAIDTEQPIDVGGETITYKEVLELNSTEEITQSLKTDAIELACGKKAVRVLLEKYNGVLDYTYTNLNNEFITEFSITLTDCK